MEITANKSLNPTGNRELKPSGAATGVSEPSLRVSKISASWALRDELWVIVGLNAMEQAPSLANYRLKTVSMGKPRPGINIDKALDWANRQEDHAMERPILAAKGS